VVLISGCAGDQYLVEDRPQKYPDNYKTELLAFLRIYLNDPTKVRDAAIADPVLMPTSVFIVSRGSGDDGGRGGRGREGGGQFEGGDGGSLERRVTRERYVVCVRFNAKSRGGDYTGAKTGMAIYAGGRFDSFNDQPRGGCDQVEFKPFPELEKLTR
jgi:hypothetical protein